MKRKRPYLVYLFAEPAKYGDDVTALHRQEIGRFTAAVEGAQVGFKAISYREWLKSWPESDPELVARRAAIITTFGP